MHRSAASCLPALLALVGCFPAQDLPAGPDDGTGSPEAAESGDSEDPGSDGPDSDDPGSDDPDSGDPGSVEPDTGDDDAPRWSHWARTPVVLDPIEQLILASGDPDVSVIAVTGDGEVIHRKGYGALHEDVIFTTASAAKPLTSGIIFRLHQQGVVDMTAPLSETTDWGDALPGVTLEHLVTHRSGLPGLVPEVLQSGMFVGGSAQCYADFVQDWTLQTCRAELVHELETNDRLRANVVPPDTEYIYGGAAWGLGAAVGEAASGKPWATLFAETYTQPCGLTQTGVVAGDELVAQILGGDIVLYDDVSEVPPTDNPNAEGGVYTTLDDYSAILMMHLHDGWCPDGQPFTAEEVAEMHRSVAPPGGPVPDFYQQGEDGGYGFGWYSGADPEQWVGAVGMGGVWGVVDKEHDMVFMVVGDPRGDLFRPIWDILKDHATAE